VKNTSHTNTLIVCLHVDDLIIIGNEDAERLENLRKR